MTDKKTIIRKKRDTEKKARKHAAALTVVCALQILLTACASDSREIKQNDSVKSSAQALSPFFFPVEGDALVIPVNCEIGKTVPSDDTETDVEEGFFEGSAALQINKVTDAKLNNLYEVKLTELEGTCDVHQEPSTDCYYSQDYFVGCFYIMEDIVYMVGWTPEDLAVLCEIDDFPEGIGKWNDKLAEEGAHYGYLSYRIVCMDEGMDDTFGRMAEDDELAEGKIYQDNYHNSISVVGDERRYNLYPTDFGTREYLYIRWQKDRGIVDYAGWTGGFMNYLAFHVPDYEDYFSIHNANNAK